MTAELNVALLTPLLSDMELTENHHLRDIINTEQYSMIFSNVANTNFFQLKTFPPVAEQNFTKVNN